MKIRGIKIIPGVFGALLGIITIFFGFIFALKVTELAGTSLGAIESVNIGYMLIGMGVILMLTAVWSILKFQSFPIGVMLAIAFVIILGLTVPINGKAHWNQMLGYIYLAVAAVVMITGSLTLLV